MIQQPHSWEYIWTLDKTIIQKDTSTPMFTAALFTIAKTWKQPKCPSTDGLIKKTRYIDTMEYSVQFSHSVVSDSLRPHEWQHARPPCPSPTPGVHSDSHPSSQWCRPAISSSVVPFSSCPQSLPASESFPMNQPLAWGGQSTGVSASASFPPKKSQGWSTLEWTGWISLQSHLCRLQKYHPWTSSVMFGSSQQLRVNGRSKCPHP